MLRFSERWLARGDNTWFQEISFISAHQW